jgi:hypothetical protein
MPGRRKYTPYSELNPYLDKGTIYDIGQDNEIWELEENGTGGGTWGSITGTLSDQTDLQSAIDAAGMTAQQIADLLKATVPTSIAFPSDGVVSLDRTAGRPYNSYDMASGAKTITVAASPEENGYCYGSIISDATNIPDVTALTVWSGTYDNINDVVNHYIIFRKNGVNYIQWHQIS